ncbi:MAG TPA: YdeI/OmpD-associated family protein [Candidatus Dojkabacteria bacterium]|nr:YdeI/OmpD-associated family protein [Candidatus Dojkabacteria bacterium]
MSTKTISGGTVHKLTQDIKTALSKDPKALGVWESLTSLARNEWICWVTFPKKKETRKEHVTRVISELKEGIRRPCCWIGCIHRKDKAISPSIQYVLSKRSKAKM